MALRLGNGKQPSGTGLFGSVNKAPAPATADRNVRVRFDVERKVLIEPAYASTFHYTDIVWGAGMAQGVCKVDGLGIQLEPRQRSGAQGRERTDMTDAAYRSTSEGGLLIMPSKMTSVDLIRAPSEIPGATTGAHANLLSSGDRYYQLEYTAGENITGSAYRLSADQTAYPGPATNDTYVSDRVILANTNHNFRQGTFFEFMFPGGMATVTNIPLKLYFSGPASYVRSYEPGGATELREIVGLGQFCLVLRGTGEAELFERNQLYLDGVLNSTTWDSFYPLFRWAPPNRIEGQRHVIYIKSTVYPQSRNGSSGTIYVSTGSPMTGGGELLKAASSHVGHQSAGFDSIFMSRRIRIPCHQAEPPPTQAVPLRVDAARGTRPLIQLGRAKYATTGTVILGPFSIPTLNLAAHPEIIASAFGDIPTGTSVQMELLTPTMDPLTDSTLFLNEHGIQRSFVNRRELQAFYIKLTLTGDGFDTPTIRYIDVSKEPVIDDSAFVPFTGGIDQDVSITGAEADPTHASARIQIQDPTGDLIDNLGIRENVGVWIDTEYSGVVWSAPAAEGRQSVLFMGWTQDSPDIHEQKDIKTLGGVSMAWPTQDWRNYQIALLGEHYRASWSHLPFNYDFNIDPVTYTTSNVLPWKVTDIIRLCLLWMGYPEEEIDVPDLPVRVFPRQTDKPLAISSGSNLLEFAQKLTLDYLGYILWHDANSGDGATPTAWKGKWRLRPPTTPPYTPLAYFTRTGVAGATKKLPHMLGAYPLSGAAVGSPILGRPKKWKKALETNHLIVAGIADTGPQTDDPHALVQRKINFTSYSPDPANPTADPTHPDFLGIPKIAWYIDTNLSTPEAINWMTNRLYDVAAHTIQGLSFVAPLVLVTDSNDTHQKRPRPLAFYDPVEVEGEIYLVRSCNPHWSKVSQQMMYLEVEQPREPYNLY